MSSYQDRIQLRKKIALELQKCFTDPINYLSPEYHGIITDFSLWEMRIIYLLDDTMLIIDNIGTPSELRISFDTITAHVRFDWEKWRGKIMSEYLKECFSFLNIH